MIGIGMGVTLVVKRSTWSYPESNRTKKKRGSPAGRAGTATLEKGLQDFSSDQEQARSKDRHVQHAVIVSGASKDQQQITTVHLVSLALHAACLITL